MSDDLMKELVRVKINLTYELAYHEPPYKTATRCLI
jgi:hypothetical protein